MPLHFSSKDFSRRRFIRSMAGAGGGALVWSWRPASGLAAEIDGGEERWALLADTHIDADEGKVSRQGTCMGETFRAVVKEVVAEADTLDGVIIDGDCAFNEGLPGDYETFAVLLQPLVETGVPIHMTMGNHDNRGPFYEALDRRGATTSPVEGKHVSVIEGRVARWVLLDSLRFVNKVEGEF